MRLANNPTNNHIVTHNLQSVVRGRKKQEFLKVLQDLIFLFDEVPRKLI